MTTGALQGLLFCGNILIPSLFPFMVLSAFVVKSGLADYLGQFLTPITRRIFHTNGTVGAVILLGLTGGFPVGAKGVATLYDEGKINLKTAQALVMFLVGGGPGFVVFVAGASLYHSTTTGLLLWLSQIVAQMIIGIFACRNIEYSELTKSQVHKEPLSTAIVNSTQSGINSIMSLCGLVIIFSCIYGICEDIGFTKFISNTLIWAGVPRSVGNSIPSVLWEVTNGCNMCSNNVAPVWLVAFALGWGGICVHFQVYSLTTKLQIPKLKFTLYRLAQGIISSIMTAVIFSFYTPVSDVYNSTAQITGFSGNNYIGSTALIAMCILFTMCVDSQT